MNVTTFPSGTKVWYNKEGRIHRPEKEGAAIEWANGDRDYHLNGNFHREDGPAILREFLDEDYKIKKWYRHGKYLYGIIYGVTYYAEKE